MLELSYYFIIVSLFIILLKFELKSKKFADAKLRKKNNNNNNVLLLYILYILLLLYYNCYFKYINNSCNAFKNIEYKI